MKIKPLVSLTTLPVLLSAPAQASTGVSGTAPPLPRARNQHRKTAIFPGNFTTNVNVSIPIIPLPSPEKICLSAFQDHHYTSLTSNNPAEACGEAAAIESRKNLRLAAVGYQLAGDDALKEGYRYKAALSYSKAAVLEHTLGKLNDAGLPDAINPLGGQIGMQGRIGSGVGAASSQDSSEAKAFIAFQQIGDYVGMRNLRKNLGAMANARFPELSDVEKVERYNFHDIAAWEDVSKPGDLAEMEKTLNSGNILRLKFDTDLTGAEKIKLLRTSRPDTDDLKMYGNAFVSLIDSSPTFRHYFYAHMERMGGDTYVLRVNLEQNAKALAYAPVGGISQTLFPYHPDSKKPTVTLDEVKKGLLHEFGHNVQPGLAKDSEGMTVLRPLLGYPHDRGQTAFMGGVINEYNHFLAIAHNTTSAPDTLGTPIKKNVDKDDYCEDLMLYQPEWQASKASPILQKTTAAIDGDNAGEALTLFSKIATSDHIDIRMYNANMGRNATFSTLDTYNLAEVTLQQMLVQIDKADWFAAEDTAENKSTRATMGEFLNLLVEQGPRDGNDPDWRTTINGAFDYLSMDPKLEIPGYAYADDTPIRRPPIVTEPTETKKGASAVPAPLVGVMTLMSLIIAGLSTYIAKKSYAQRSAAAATAAQPASPGATVAPAASEPALAPTAATELPV